MRNSEAEAYATIGCGCLIIVVAIVGGLSLLAMRIAIIIAAIHWLFG